MMLLGHDEHDRWLRVALATIHISIKSVPGKSTPEKITLAIELAAQACRDLRLPRARVAVCGLNPHAGEGGEFGDEEIKTIAPTVLAAQKSGLDVVGPLSGDTVFHYALRGDFDAVVAMYHDQGLAPLKAVAFDTGVNWTLGLPFIRTSPDHGTAYDIAGKGIANPVEHDCRHPAGEATGSKSPVRRPCLFLNPNECAAGQHVEERNQIRRAARWMQPHDAGLPNGHLVARAMNVNVAGVRIHVAAAVEAGFESFQPQNARGDFGVRQIPAARCGRSVGGFEKRFPPASRRRFFPRCDAGRAACSSSLPSARCQNAKWKAGNAFRAEHNRDKGDFDVPGS